MNPKNLEALFSLAALKTSCKKPGMYENEVNDCDSFLNICI